MEKTYEIKAKLGTIGKPTYKGDTLQVNIVNWHRTKDKVDIRRWSENYDKAGKGITLTYEEAKTLLALLTEYFKEVD